MPNESLNGKIRAEAGFFTLGSALGVVAGDRGGDPVLGAAGGVDVGGVHQDREGDRVVAGLAVARERRDVGERAGLGRGSCPRRRCPACGRRRCPRGRRPAASRGTRRRRARRRAIATSSLPTCSGETRFLRESPEPSTAWTSVPTDLANASTLLLPRWRVPFLPLARAEPLEQHLGEEVVRGHVGLLDQLRDGRRGDRGERLARRASRRTGWRGRPCPRPGRRACAARASAPWRRPARARWRSRRRRSRC